MTAILPIKKNYTAKISFQLKLHYSYILLEDNSLTVSFLDLQYMYNCIFTLNRISHRTLKSGISFLSVRILNIQSLRFMIEPGETTHWLPFLR